MPKLTAHELHILRTALMGYADEMRQAAKDTKLSPYKADREKAPAVMELARTAERLITKLTGQPRAHILPNLTGGLIEVTGPHGPEVVREGSKEHKALV